MAGRGVCLFMFGSRGWFVVVCCLVGLLVVGFHLESLLIGCFGVYLALIGGGVITGIREGYILI